MDPDSAPLPISAQLWGDRRTLVTGHTGFKGAWLSLWLEQLGAELYGLALPPTGEDSAIDALTPGFQAESYCDIRDRGAVVERFLMWKPQVVFHLAAQSLVPAGYREPVRTYETNVIGTVNVLSAAVEAGVDAVVVVTSDKVYANDNSGREFSEADPLGGNDPYSASKACADIATRAWRSSITADRTAIAVARAGNVIGGGDVALDRLLPDARRALDGAMPLKLRRPAAVRPWQFVLEPLRGYLHLAERLITSPTDAPPAVNFGPGEASCRRVCEVVDLAYGCFGEGTWTKADGVQPHEETLLRLDSSLADRVLDWRPALDLETSVSWTVDWWMQAIAAGDLRALALRQLGAYTARVS